MDGVERDGASVTDPVVLVHHEGPILWITLNRPEKLNALTPEMLELLREALLRARTDEETRVIIIRGAGRAFSAGHDVSPGSAEVTGAGDAVDDYERQRFYLEVFLSMWEHPKPVIAAVHGYCLAGAAHMATFADFIIAADDAVIAPSPPLPLGGGLITPLWAFSVGASRAKLLSFVPGYRISGTQAADWGWAVESVPVDDLENRARDLALHVSRMPPHVLRMKKVAINRVLEMQGFRIVATTGAETDVVVHGSEDVRKMKEIIGEHGLSRTRRAFQEGSPPL